MSDIRYYTDEHVSRAVIRGLQQRGVDTLSVPEANMLDAADEAQLAFAKREGKVIFIQDDDFLRLAASGVPHVGVVYAPQYTPVGKVIRGLMLIHQILTAQDMVSKVEYI